MRIVRFLRRLPLSVRLAGGIINPWLWPAVRSAWLSTGPPPEPIEMSDQEWENWNEIMKEM